MSQMNTPPMSSDFDMHAPLPGWPKVVGIISIVWASLGMLCNTCGVLGQAMQGAVVNMVPPEQQEQMKAQMQAGQSPLVILSYVIGVVASILLLVAGIQTLRRNASGRMLHLAWAVISLLLAIFGGIVGWQQMNTNLAHTLQNDPNAAQAQGAATGIAYVMFGCIMVLTLIWPVFCVVWFGMKGKRPEAGAGIEEPIV